MYNTNGVLQICLYLFPRERAAMNLKDFVTPEKRCFLPADVWVHPAFAATNIKEMCL